MFYDDWLGTIFVRCRDMRQGRGMKYTLFMVIVNELHQCFYPHRGR